MMKKLISAVLALACLLTLAGCSKSPKKQAVPITTPTYTQGALADIDLQKILYVLEDISGTGVGQYCYQEDITSENVSAVLGSDSFKLPFAAARAYLPTMSTTAFVLAVFRLEQGADAQAFANALKDNADPDRWVCVRAEKVEALCHGNLVMFVMGNEASVYQLSQAFHKFSEPGFRMEEHLIDRLEGLTMDKLYTELYKKYSVAQYGFMDGEDFGAISDSAGYGLADISAWQYTDSVVDTGYFAADAYDGERSYLLAMFRLAPEVDSAAFAQELLSCLDTSSLKGDGQQYVVAWSDDVVACYVGAGSLAWNTFTMESEFSGIYRMETQTSEN